MTRRKRLMTLGPSQEAETADVELNEGEVLADPLPGNHADETLHFDEDWEESAPPRRFARALPALAVVLIVCWTGFFAWNHQQDMLTGASMDVWISWITDWAVPVLLIVTLWLLLLRNSTREAARFGETAQMLSAESANLETRLTAINRELSMARDFIAAQSRDLESLGRIAVERLSSNADRLQELVIDNGEQVNAIGQVSDNAVSNMDKLRDQMPVISNSARDLANQIGSAGNTAQSQLDAMGDGFERLNQLRDASEQQVDGLRAKVAETLQEFETQASNLDRMTHDRFETLRSEGSQLTGTMRAAQEEAQDVWSAAIEQLRVRMSDAIAEISRIDEAAIGNTRKRLEALSQAAETADRTITEKSAAFESEVASRQEQQDANEAQALDKLAEQLAAFDSQIASRQQAHLEHVAGLALRGEELAGRLNEMERGLTSLSEQGNEGSNQLNQSAELFAEKLSQSRAILEESGTFVGRLTDDSVRLLEIIRASADYSEGTLSDSIGQAETRLSSFEQQAVTLGALISEAETKGQQITAHIEQASGQSQSSLDTVAELETRLANLASQSATMAEQARDDLQGAITTLEDASTQMLGSLRNDQTEAVREIAAKIGNEGSEAIVGALRDGSAQAISELEQSALKAGEQGRQTASQLRDQLAMVNELAGNLEQRVSQARAVAEEQVDGDFSRSMALITESLNSSAIDISKAFDNEVTDTSWAGYLRGDRGIFTRRAVRLLDNHEARAVSDVYEEDSDFRETVNRYIHDFEGMLRTVLSTRDGNSMAVTLLSSDMGKLYVALAQAIERLRN